MRSLLTVVLVAGWAVSLAAQSPGSVPLGELAKQEEARRKAIAKTAKVYTNDSLKPEPARPAAPTAATAPATPASLPSPETQPEPKTPAPVAADETKTEAYWRKRINLARASLERSQMFQEALQSRINALKTEFVNRDDPAQRDRIAADRQKALAELDRVTIEIRQHKKAIDDIEEAARRAGVPPGWLR